MARGSVRPHAQMRQSQIVTTFGPGAMVDLPSHAVLIGGLECWSNDRRPIFEERLVAKLETLLGIENLRLFAPPIDNENPAAPKSGISVWEFPEWFIAQQEERPGEGLRSRPLVHREALSKGKYLGHDKRRHSVVPVRFVQACLNGHVSDIRWREFVHRGVDPCGRPLWMDERGTSGDLADVFVRCECGKRRTLVEGTLGAGEAAPLGYCDGQRPWLGKAARERCGAGEGPAQPNRLLVRSASNAYFAQTLSVISIPDRDALLRQAVDPVYEDFLQYAESLDDLRRERRRERVHNALLGFDDDAVFGEIERRRGQIRGSEKSIKQAEIEMLLAAPAEILEGAPDGVFHARTLRIEPSCDFSSLLDRIVRVDRLREVTAQVGFTRFEAASPDVEGELSVEVRRADLARETTWLPAVENRGEGIFLAFRPDAVTAWLARRSVKERGDRLLEGFERWHKAHPGSKARFPGLPYVMLHSLSHLLIASVSLECGYAASSIRERIYAGQGGYGILLHTGTPDAEGTLGGLVQVARRIGHHLGNALELGRLCSNDPVCAQHQPDHPHEERFLHGAACHGCLLIAEPSCERRNEFLDRTLVVPTVDGSGAEFLREEER